MSKIGWCLNKVGWILIIGVLIWLFFVTLPYLLWAWLLVLGFFLVGRFSKKDDTEDTEEIPEIENPTKDSEDEEK